jgi:hypothetical protein
VGLHVVEMGGLPELGTWRGEITLRPGTSYIVRGTLGKLDEAPTPAPAPHHGHAAERAAQAANGAAPPTSGSAADAGARVAGNGAASGTDPGAAVEKPYRPPPDSGILFLDLQGGAARAP